MAETNFDAVGASEIRIGQADIIESELEQLDGVTPGTAAASKALVLDANKEARGAGIGNKVSAASANGAITQKLGTIYITKGSAAALTIADPTATDDDGCRLAIISTTAFAHTISNAAGSGFNAGGASSDVATLGGARGDNIVIEAYQGKWYVVSSVNVTLG